MTPQQQARDRAVSLIRQIVRLRTPMMSEETRDQVAREIETIVDDLVAAVTPKPSDRGELPFGNSRIGSALDDALGARTDGSER